MCTVRAVWGKSPGAVGLMYTQALNNEGSIGQKPCVPILGKYVAARGYRYVILVVKCNTNTIRMSRYLYVQAVVGAW